MVTFEIPQSDENADWIKFDRINTAGDRLASDQATRQLEQERKEKQGKVEKDAEGS